MMDKKLKSFLSSGALDRYITGIANHTEKAEAEYFIENFTEAKKLYLKLQTQLEINDALKAEEAPSHLLSKIIDEIEPSYPKNQNQFFVNRFNWYPIAATISTVCLAITSFILFNKNQNLNSENQIIAEEVFDLRDDINTNNERLNNVLNQFSRLNNHNTEKYIVEGNHKGEQFKSVAYINPVEKLSIIDVVELPKLEEDESFQMWAHSHNKTFNLGALNDSLNNLKHLPFVDGAVSYSITVESKKSSNQIKSNKKVAEFKLVSK
jgi:hypothetical protein